MFIRINRKLKYLWRAVDQEDSVLDILVQACRDKAAARRFFPRLVEKTRAVPRLVVTDTLHSCGAAHPEGAPSMEHRSHKGPNNRAENSHQPTRMRDEGLASVCGAQRFLSAPSGNSPHFGARRHLMTTLDHRAERTVRFAIWGQAADAVSRHTTA
ncbi:transposase-like protein [Streptomyces canus]|nr:transposase-like protein [Streptomyces canus]